MTMGKNDDPELYEGEPDGTPFVAEDGKQDDLSDDEGQE